MKKIYLIALVFALLCGFLVYTYLGNVENRVAQAEKEHQVPEVKMTGVVVAARDIPPMTEITEEMVFLDTFPEEYVDENAARTLDDVIGLQADGTIVKGQMIMTTAVGTLEEIIPDLAARIPEGMRAMTISVSTSSGVGGYIKADNSVDILGYIPGDPDENIPEVLEITIRNAKVLAVGDAVYSDESGSLYSSLTLALTQSQTLQVLELIEKGDYYFTLYRMDTDGGQMQ